MCLRGGVKRRRNNCHDTPWYLNIYGSCTFVLPLKVCTRNDPEVTLIFFCEKVKTVSFILRRLLAKFLMRFGKRLKCSREVFFPSVRGEFLDPAQCEFVLSYSPEKRDARKTIQNGRPKKT